MHTASWALAVYLVQARQGETFQGVVLADVDGHAYAFSAAASIVRQIKPWRCCRQLMTVVSRFLERTCAASGTFHEVVEPILLCPASLVLIVHSSMQNRRSSKLLARVGQRNYHGGSGSGPMTRKCLTSALITSGLAFRESLLTTDIQLTPKAISHVSRAK